MPNREKTVLVTGGTGFIGSHLVKRLVDQKRHVYVTGREAVPPGAVLAHTDFSCLPTSLIQTCSAVFHLAAETNTRAPDREHWEVNYEKAAEFIREARESGVERIVYASSGAVYGRLPTPFSERHKCEPLNAYGAAKLALDKLLNPIDPTKSLPYSVSVRPMNVFGPGEDHKGKSASYVSQILKNARDAKAVTLFSNCQRDLVCVDDAADIFLAAETFKPGIYNCGSGVAADYLSVATECGKILNRITRVERKPCPFPSEFQEFTLASMVKTVTAMNILHGVWVPQSWRVVLAKYIREGWVK